MKKLILITLFVFATLTINAANYYISTSGTDGAGINGSIGTPWKTLAYACTRVSNGDIINVGVGTFIETSQCILPVGVSIVGAGVTSVIKSHYYVGGEDGTNKEGLIRLWSSSQNTAGNQSISYIKLDGDGLTGNGAIFVRYRSNVLIHHCTIVDFNYNGIVIEGENSWNSQPVAFSTGNQIYNNTITNCHGGGGGGNIRITGQTVCEIHDNIVDGRTRSMQNSITLSNNKATKIYNNTIYTLNNRGAAFNFAFEIWDTWGGLEIYNNTFIGGGTIDLGGHYIYKGAYAFGASVHNNTFTLPALEVYNASEVIAITVESWTTLNDIYIYSNHIKNFGTGIQVTFGMNSGGTASNFYIYNNIFENIGYSDTQGGSSAIGFLYQAGVETASFNNINIYNNVMIAGGSNSNIGIRYSVVGTTTNLNIKNNIIKGFAIRAINFINEAGSLNNLAITNNIFYSNGATINLGGITPTNYTSTPNYTTNPLFVSTTDFHLSSTSSPAYHTGVNVSLTNDYDNYAWNNPPSIGAYEYITGGIVVPTITTTAASSVTKSTANTGGNVTATGGATVTDRGVCYSLSINPTITDSHVHAGTGSGSFASSLSGLSFPATYHVRAFATNSAGTAYGTDKTFITRSFSFVVW